MCVWLDVSPLRLGSVGGTGADSTLSDVSSPHVRATFPAVSQGHCKTSWETEKRPGGTGRVFCQESGGAFRSINKSTLQRGAGRRFPEEGVTGERVASQQ